MLAAAGPDCALSAAVRFLVLLQVHLAPVFVRLFVCQVLTSTAGLRPQAATGAGGQHASSSSRSDTEPMAHCLCHPLQCASQTSSFTEDSPADNDILKNFARWCLLGVVQSPGSPTWAWASAPLLAPQPDHAQLFAVAAAVPCACCLQGEPSCVAQAVVVVTAAVDRYKELCEGKYSGECHALCSCRTAKACSGVATNIFIVCLLSQCDCCSGR